MKNRISRYLGEFQDIDRAADTLNFCDALVHLHVNLNMPSGDLNEISQLQIEAIKIFRNLGVPLPWERH